MEDNKQLWEAVLGALEVSISKANFTTWFRSTSILETNNGEVVIGVPNAFTKEWMENKYHKEISQAITNITRQPVRKISFIIGKGNRTQQAEPSMNELSIQTNTPNLAPATVLREEIEHIVSQEARDNLDPTTNLNPKYTFESYIVGSNNELAAAACRAVAVNPGGAYNPLFIYGGVGLGKTHLMQAIGNEVLKRNPNKKIQYVTCETFTNEMVEALGKHRMEQFKNSYREVDVLILDDVQFISGKEKTQEEFFHTFNTLYESNKQIVLSSDRPPKAIQTLEERLRSRFEGGMIADISSPDLETRMAILREKSRHFGVNFSDEIISYIAANIQNNIRELEGALKRIVASAELSNREPSLESTKEILASIINTPKKRALLPRQVLETVAGFYDISLEDLKGKSRKKETVVPRQIVMYLLREEIKSSYPMIGRELGGRDHTTAMHACQKIEKELEKDESLSQEIELIRQKLYTA
jgi:chromosomal replication initiator protein